MSEVFTSYSRRDIEPVDTVVDGMKESGLSVWIDREEIKAGNQWRVQIVEAIDTCDAFALMLSPNSAASDNVRKEIDLAQDSNRTIFAMMLEPVKVPAAMRYQLAGLQFLDVQMLGFEKASDQLIETIKEHIKKIRPAAETRQTELVIQGVDISAFSPEKQQQLLEFISKISDTDISKLKIEKVETGSLHVFVQMPSKTAYQLKTMALNRDSRFKPLGIVSLRLDGNKKFINTSLGILTTTATISPLMILWLRIPAMFSSTLSLATGKLLTIFSSIAVTAGLVLFASSLTPDLPLPPPSVTSTWTPPPAATSTPESTPTFSPEPTSTFTPTQEPASTPTETASPTFTPVPTYGIFDGNLIAEIVACNYGPGPLYLNRYGMIAGYDAKVLGRNEAGDWVFVQVNGYESPCWVSVKSIKMNGDVSSLELYYPEKAPLPPFNNPKFPPPQLVNVARSGNKVYITWKGYELALGDMQNSRSYRYLLEAWTCKGGEIVFTSNFTNREDMVIDDDEGCSAFPRARLFMIHKDGYINPITIPWPPYPTPTP